jgi:hypothetical protein
MPQTGVSKISNSDTLCVPEVTITVTVSGKVYHPEYQIGQWVRIGLGKYGKVVGVAWQANLPQLHHGYWSGQYHQPGFEYQVQEQGDLTDWMIFCDFQENQLQPVTDPELEQDLERERLMLLQEISARPLRYFTPD